MSSFNVLTPSNNEVFSVEIDNRLSDFARDLITPYGQESVRNADIVVAADDVTEYTLGALFTDHEVDRTRTEEFRGQRLSQAAGTTVLGSYL